MNPLSAHHTLPQRVYYEDTDFSGLVYHANYLKFFERGRTEWLRQAGVEQMALLRSGYAFVVTHVSVDFHASALMDDWLEIHTRVAEKSAARLMFAQSIVRRDDAPPGKTLITAEVCVAAINAARKPVRLREVLPAWAD